MGLVVFYPLLKGFHIKKKIHCLNFVVDFSSLLVYLVDWLCWLYLLLTHFGTQIGKRLIFKIIIFGSLSQHFLSIPTTCEIEN